MKTSWKILICDFVLVGLVSLVLAEDKPLHNVPAKPASPQKPAVAKPPDFSVLGYIEKRDRTITIKSGPKGTVYSVKSADGKLLFENLSAEQLRAKAPELHDFVKTAVAGNSGAKADARIIPVKIDASVGAFK